METIPDPRLHARVALALDLYELALEMMRHNLPRQFPQESHAEIDARIAAWHRRPTGSPCDEWSQGPFEARRLSA